MTPSPTLQALIDGVKADAPGEAALIQLSQASKTVSDLEQVGDALLGHFVDQCRRSGHSWSEISSALGVSKQAAHKRFTFDVPAFERFTERARASSANPKQRPTVWGTDSSGPNTSFSLCSTSRAASPLKVLDGAGISKSIVERASPGADQAHYCLGGRKIAVHSEGKGGPSWSRGGGPVQLDHNYIGTEHLLLGLLAMRTRSRPRFSGIWAPATAPSEIEPSNCWLASARIDHDRGF